MAIRPLSSKDFTEEDYCNGSGNRTHTTIYLGRILIEAVIQLNHIARCLEARGGVVPTQVPAEVQQVPEKKEALRLLQTYDPRDPFAGSKPL